MILCNLFTIYFDFSYPISKSNEYPDLWRRKILAVRVSKFSRQSCQPLQVRVQLAESSEAKNPLHTSQRMFGDLVSESILAGCAW